MTQVINNAPDCLCYILAHDEFQAVEGSKDHLLLNALDSRAATYEKLEKSKLAYGDAKTMLKTFPKLSKVRKRLHMSLTILTRVTGLPPNGEAVAAPRTTSSCFRHL